MFEARPAQQEVLRYQGSLMGVAAVPGSGKTAVLSALAAKLVAESVDEDQEVLIVTLVNSAVDNFAARIHHFLRQENGLLLGAGYRVRTLHGLASDIVRERPSLVGLADDFAIADDREAGGILQDAARSWLATHEELLDFYLGDQISPGRKAQIQREHWPQSMTSTAEAFIKRAKDRSLNPETVRSWLTSLGEPWLLARFCVDVYSDYQQSLGYRGKADFDDLVRYAIAALRMDDDYLQRLRHRWPFVLEDEAQDSSHLQQELLAMLVGSEGRWVRVGDSNQAVYYTFTTADPELLRGFLKRPSVRTVEMSESGRSAPAIMQLANHLVDWTMDEHPLEEARDAFRQQHIHPTASGDAQPNPPAAECVVYFDARRMSPDEELHLIVKSLAKWVPEHPMQTVAVLVPDNARGVKFADRIRAADLPCVELLRTKGKTRETASAIADVLMHLASPHNPRGLSKAFLAWKWEERQDKAQGLHLEGVADLLAKCSRVEQYLWPRASEYDWLQGVEARCSSEELELLEAFRVVAQGWHRAVGMPVDQLVLTLSQQLFDVPGDLARAYRFAVALRAYQEANLRWRTRELANEILVIARNERRFLGLSAEDTGFDPDKYKGQVIVATMHSAKGLEWDRVHLTAVNNYDYPSGGELDRYRSEPWYLREQLDPTAEALGQLEAMRPGGEAYVEGEPSKKAREEYIRERLRLLYVGITRARRELIVTWNTGKRVQDPKQPALAFQVLRAFWEEKLCPTPNDTSELVK